MQPSPRYEPGRSAVPPPGPPPPNRPRQSSAGWGAMVLFAFLFALGALLAVGVVGGYFAVANGLDDPQKLKEFPLAQESVVYDRTGQTELARFGEAKREIVAFDELPPALVDATTAVEDRTFWTNTGFDPAAIVSAGLDAIRGNARGASTITQQLVRARLLKPDLVQSRGRTIERKLKEIIQSIRVTKEFPGEEGKKEIITAYLNQNFYGNSSYGVKAAAKAYFGVELKDLTLAQAAIIAALPQSPSEYDLVRNAVEKDGRLVVPDDTDIVRRRNQVLDLMAQGRTPLLDAAGETPTADEFEAAKSEEVVLAPQDNVPWKAPHLVWAVRRELTARICGEEAQTCAELERGGFRITSTVDLRLQEIAEKWVKAAAIVPKAEDPEAAAAELGFDELPAWVARLTNKDVNNGALVAIDYETGELVAYVGSADYNATNSSPKFQPKFDVVGDGWRQPGSAFKPFNYLTGIDDKTITAASMFMDVGTDFGGSPAFTPNDADLLERGPVRVRSALQFSLNIPAVKAVDVNGIDRVFTRSRDFGLRYRTETSSAGLALALGVQEVRPIDLVTGYGTIGNLGRYVPHTTIVRIQNPDGSDFEIDRPEPEQVASPQAASIILDILGGNTVRSVNPFWGRFQIDTPNGRRPAGLKTGTNNDAKDLNAYGMIAPPTEEGRAAGEYALAVGVWNGNSDNEPVSTPERPVFSIDVSTFVWEGFLEEATAKWAINPLPRAEGLASVRVDPWTGLLPAAGQEGVPELFLPGTEPTRQVGASSGMCGLAVLEASPWETSKGNWLEWNRNWIERARRGPGTRGGPDGTRVSYFYNNGFNPYGRSWGPILNAGACSTPSPEPTCFAVPTPDESGVIPSFEIPTPAASDAPPPEPCPTPEPTPSPSPSETPLIETPPVPTPEPATPEPSLPPVDTPVPSVEPSVAIGGGGEQTPPPPP